VLILFNFLGLGFIDVVKERVLDTLIGCAIAFPVSYFLLPTWESEQLRTHIKNALQANSEYLSKIILALSGTDIKLLEYKTGKKGSVCSHSESHCLIPENAIRARNKQKNTEHVHEFVVIKSYPFQPYCQPGTSLFLKEKKLHSKLIQSAIYRVYKKMNETLSIIDSGYQPPTLPVIKKENENENDILSQEEILLKEQLEYLLKITGRPEKNYRTYL
jgi:hypothetical protein